MVIVHIFMMAKFISCDCIPLAFEVSRLPPKIVLLSDSIEHLKCKADNMIGSEDKFQLSQPMPRTHFLFMSRPL